MITKIEVLNYRCLKYVCQEIGQFNLLVGANASGKSTFLDAVVFLGNLLSEDIESALDGRGLTLGELTWKGVGEKFEIAIELQAPVKWAGRSDSANGTRCRYEVSIGKDPSDQKAPCILGENLWLMGAEHSSSTQSKQERLFPSEPPTVETILSRGKTPKGWKKVVKKVSESGNDYFQSETGKWNNLFRLGTHRSALANLPEDEEKFPVATWAKRFLMEGITALALNSMAMRRPSPSFRAGTFRPDGSNLPWVIKHLQKTSPERYKNWLGHVKIGLADLEEIGIVERPEDRSLYLQLTYANGLKIPSWLVSDGTLRFLALTLLAYLPSADSIYLIEEPENGIHPRAVEYVYQSLSSARESQILLASHSPVLLSLVNPEDLLCFARTKEGATDIIRGNEHPNLADWQKETDLGTLFAAGVLT